MEEVTLSEGNSTMRGFIVYTLHQILLEGSSQGG
jgi:hypothetical protein